MKMIEQVLERGEIAVLVTRVTGSQNVGAKLLVQENGSVTGRSEERRVGKECRSRWSPYH